MDKGIREQRSARRPGHCLAMGEGPGRRSNLPSVKGRGPQVPQCGGPRARDSGGGGSRVGATPGTGKERVLSRRVAAKWTREQEAWVRTGPKRNTLRDRRDRSC